MAPQVRSATVSGGRHHVRLWRQLRRGAIMLGYAASPKRLWVWRVWTREVLVSVAGSIFASC